MTFDILIDSAKMFCKEQLDSNAYEVEPKDLKNCHFVEMDISYFDNSNTICAIFCEHFLRECALKLLFEDDPCKESLKDMSCEVTNLIVGQAKTLFQQDSDEEIHIGTPLFNDIKDINKNDKWLKNFKYISYINSSDSYILILLKG